MKRLALFIGVILLVGPPGLGGVACSRPSSSSPLSSIEKTTEAIQGGTADATDKFSVAVMDPTNETCSGTLIAPNLILTARHCVGNDNGGEYVDCTHDMFDPPMDPSQLHVSTGETATFLTSPYNAIKIIVPTDATFCGNDVALIIVDKNVPASEAKPVLPSLDATLASTYGTTITAIGYGTTSPTAEDDGSRRRRDGIKLNCVPGDKALDCDPVNDYGMTVAELAIGDGLCGGDSGSAAYITTTIAAGAPQMIGLLSRASATKTKCTDAIYSRTDAHAAFLMDGAAVAAKMGNYTAPSWAAAGDAGADNNTSVIDASTPPLPNTTPTSPTTPVQDASIASTPSAAPNDDGGGGCNTSGHSGHSGLNASWLLLGLIALRRRRRRRRRRC